MFVKIFENIFQARSNVFTKFFSKEDFIKSSKVEFKMSLVLYFSCVLIVLHVFDIIPSNAILWFLEGDSYQHNWLLFLKPTREI